MIESLLPFQQYFLRVRWAGAAIEMVMNVFVPETLSSSPVPFLKKIFDLNKCKSNSERSLRRILREHNVATLFNNSIFKTRIPRCFFVSKTFMFQIENMEYLFSNSILSLQ